MGILARALMLKKWDKNRKADAIRMARQKPAEGVTLSCNYNYLGDNNPMHLADIYYKNGGEKKPVIVDIHGGGWMYGDKELNKVYCTRLAKGGFAVVNLSYRLLPETDLKGQVTDIFACLHWLEDNAENLGLNLSQVCLTGDSAGGHLAGLVLCIQLSEKLQKLYGITPVSFSFKAVALSHPVCEISDDTLVNGKIYGKELLKMMLGKKPKQNELYNYISFSQTAKGLNLPPVMIISSEEDTRFYHIAKQTAEWLEKSGAEVKTLFWQAQGGEKALGHVFHILYSEREESLATNQKTIEFLNGVLNND